MKTTITIDNKVYDLIYNAQSGYYEIEIEAPSIGGVYDIEASFIDVLGNTYTNNKKIQVLEKVIKINENYYNIAYILDKDTLEVKDFKEFTNTYNFKIDEETNANSFINVIDKPNAENGDKIYIRRKNISYLGVVSNITNANTNNDKNRLYKITLKYISNIFDREVILNNEEIITNIGIEDFIANVINNEFTNSEDDLLNYKNIKVFVHTHTKLQKSVDTDEYGIFNFHTFITNCTQNYNIIMDFELEGQFIVINIYKAQEGENKLIDTTVSDISNYKEVFETNITTKVTVKTETDVQNFYLRSDRTVTTDVNDTERAKGQIEVTYTTNSEDARQTALDIFKGNTYNHNINFNLRRDTTLFEMEKIKIGTPVSIKTKNNIIYNTYISAIEDTGEIFLKITCGNMRIDFIDTIAKKLGKERK